MKNLRWRVLTVLIGMVEHWALRSWMYDKLLTLLVLLPWRARGVGDGDFRRNFKADQLLAASWQNLREAQKEGRADLRPQIRWVSQSTVAPRHPNDKQILVDKQIDLNSVDLKKLKVRDLKKILNDWDETCEGCLEKPDFIKRIEELKPKYESASSNKKELWI